MSKLTPDRRRASVSETLAKQVARAEELHQQIQAATETEDLLRLSKALEDMTRAVCRTVEMELEQRQLDRAVERRKRELRRLVLERLAGLPPASRAIH